MRTKDPNKRIALLDAAERLFCRKGYESTSVADLMGELGLSKGGFYHHFASKEAVLSSLCERRALRSCEALEEGLAQADGPVAAVDAVLHAFMPLRTEEADFLRMLLPTITLPACREVALSYQDALLATFLPALTKALDEAEAAGLIWPELRGMERAALHLVNQCWLDAAAVLLTDPMSILPQMEAYRRAIELLLGMPYGTVEVIRLEELTALHRLVAR